MEHPMGVAVLRPGDVLVLANVGKLSQQARGQLAQASLAAGLRQTIVFPGDADPDEVDRILSEVPRGDPRRLRIVTNEDRS